MKTGILFDLDGTLLDTLQDLTDAVNHTMEQFGCRTYSRQSICRFIGNGARQLIRLAIADEADRLDLEQVLAAYKEYYAAHCQVKTVPFPGIPEALAQIRRRFPVAIVSNKPDRAVKKMCPDYFGDIYALGESADCPRKPAPDMLWKAMKALDVEQCIYIGDSEVDVLTAAAAGMPCISVLWGFRDREQIQQAGGRYFCTCAQELLPTIESILEQT